MSETITEHGMKGAGSPDVADHHEQETRGRWKIYAGVFVALFVLTILELYVGTLIEEKSNQVVALISLMMAKAILVVLYYMHLRWESRVLRWVIVIPFFAAVFFVGILLWV